MTPFHYQFILNSVEKTQSLGQALARQLKAGDILALYGDLAGGKTTFTVGLTRFFNSDQMATSPTFTLINEYDGDITLFHLDCYRIKHPDEIILMGFEDYLIRDGIMIIEWPEKIQPHLPNDIFVLHFNYIDDHTREIYIDSPRKLELDP